MDYESEQSMELEALEAIFADHLEEFEGNTPEGWAPAGKIWAITIHPSAEAEAGPDEDPELQMQLVWAHTARYPDEPPSIRLRSIKGLGDQDLREATDELQRHIQESLGMPMIYNLVTAAQEWLAARVAAGPAGAGLDPDAEEKRKREEEEAARAAARAHGTPVTVEAFLQWKAAYDAERKKALAEAAAAAAGKAGDAKEGRVTGKQWFMQQLAAGKGESSGSEVGEDEGDFDEGLDELGDEDEDEEEEFDFEEGSSDDDDEDGMLDEYLAAKKS